MYASAVRSVNRPAIHVIGSGDRLSVLVVSGSTRVLLAGGDDGSAFMNGLADTLGLSGHGIDAAVISGADSDMAVANRVVRDIAPDRMLMVEGPLADRRSELTKREIVMIARPISIELPDATRIVVTPSPSAGELASGEWTATIMHRNSTVLVASRLDRGIEWSANLEALIVCGDAKADALVAVPAAAFVLRSTALDRDELESAIGDAENDRWLVRVGETSAARIGLVESGLELPGSAFQLTAER